MKVALIVLLNIWFNLVLYKKCNYKIIGSIILSLLGNIFLNKLFFYTYNFSNYLYIIIFTFFINAIIMFLKVKRKDYKFINFLFAFIFISLFVELFVFNIKHFISYNNKEINIPYNINNSNEEQNSVIEFKNINRKIKNVYLDIADSTVKISVCDEGSHLYYDLPSIEILKNNERSKYHILHLMGKTNKIKMTFSLQNNELQKLDKIIFNTKVPLMFSIERFITIFIILFLCYLLHFQSKIYNYKLFETKNRFAFLAMIVCVFLSIFGYLGSKNNFISSYNTVAESHQEYYFLVESLIKGHVYIDEKPSDTLKNMKNPYDREYRDKLHNQNGEGYFWDYAFHKGKYYVYFGIGPAILIYLPFYLITGYHISNAAVILIFLFLTILNMIFLLYEFCKKYFPNIKMITFILCLIFFILSSNLFYISKRPDFYSVPIIAALNFTILGFAILLSGLNNQKLFKTKLFLGSLSLAFTVLCRPQFLITSILLIPMYFDYFFKNHSFKESKYFKEFLMILIPYILIGSFAMYYNYIRFGSVLNFGAQYNLTTNDMVHRKLDLARIPLGIWTYLFMPCTFSLKFPFLEKNTMNISYLGKTIYEPMFGGFIFTHILTILSLFVYRFKNVIKDKKLYTITNMLVIFSFIIIIFDTEMAGLLPRYISDFSYLLAFATIIIILSLFNYFSETKLHNILYKIFIGSIVLIIVYEFLFIFNDIDVSMKDFAKEFFYHIYYLFMFY